MTVIDPTARPDIVIPAGADPAFIQDFMEIPGAFARMCKIVRFDDTVGYMTPTAAQMEVISAIDSNRMVLVDKYRQAMITTIVLMHLLLRDCMYYRGFEGLLIANDNPTAESAFQRLIFAYENFEPSLRVPLATGTRGSARSLRFIHGGGISITSLESKAPGVGRSLARLHITELGEVIHQKRALMNVLPSMNRRPFAKAVIESTPGRVNTYHHETWKNACNPHSFSEWFPVFLKWWQDETCRLRVPEGYEPTKDDKEFLRTHPGADMGNALFRRVRMESDFVGDSRLYRSKYPSHEADGWLGSDRPQIPEEIIDLMLLDAKEDPVDMGDGCGIYKQAVDGAKYLVVVDPCGFGKVGDPAALTVFRTDTLEEVAVWSGREDPDILALRTAKVCAYYNEAISVVESNHAGCITALLRLNVKIIWSKRQPGWYATSDRIGVGEAELVRGLRSRMFHIVSKKGLQQLREYDGNFQRRVTDEDGGHHFDRARTYIMAAEMLLRGASVGRAQDKEKSRKEKLDELMREAVKNGQYPAAMLLGDERTSVGPDEAIMTIPKHR
jgi:hypothetical protein